MRKYIIPLLLGAIFYTSCPTDTGEFSVPVSPVQVVRSAIPGDLMGMVHAGDRSDEVEREYALLNELGVQWMLTDFSWNSIEGTEGVWTENYFDAYTNNGKDHEKKILAILDYDVGWIHDGNHDSDDHGNAGDDRFTDGAGHKYIAISEIPFFIEYVKKTVYHYQDRVDAWCIWNEPNLEQFWRGTQLEFFELTKATVAAIRKVDPDAFIIGGAFNTLVSEDWVRGFFEFDPDMIENINAIAYHPYTIGPGSTANMYNYFKKIVSEYGFGDKIWVTEVGYPTYDKAPRPADRYGTDILEANMPETVMQTIVLLTANGAQRLFWYHLFDPKPEDQDDTDSEDWFGLIKRDLAWTWKGGAVAYRLAAKNIPGTVCKIPERAGLSDAIQAYYFEGSDGRHTLVIWNNINTAKDVQVYLPGVNQKVYNLATGEAASIGETSTYTLKTKDGVNHFIQFFTWENPGSSLPPRISAN
jgi:hypothetical protein